MIKTIPQAIDDMAVSLGASPSAQIPTISQALENVYARLGGTRTDLDTMVISEVIDLLTPLVNGGGGGGGVELPTFSISADDVMSSEASYSDVKTAYTTYGEDGQIPAIIISAPEDATYWSMITFVADVSEYEVPESVTERFSIGNYLFGNDGNFYGGDK